MHYKRKHKSALLGTLALVLTLILPLSAVSAQSYPEIIPLPNGWQPEGVVVGTASTIYAGSLADGAIYRASLRTGEGEVLVPPQDGRISVGLAYDMRSGNIFAAGGPGGAGYVYDSTTGESLAAYEFAAENSFVNDVVVTRDAAYFTDSSQPRFYRVPLGPGGSLPDADAVETIELGGDWEQVDGFNANGIDATANGDALIIVQSATGTIFKVDPTSGEAQAIDLDGATLDNGDGILLKGRILYVVQNRLNQIAVVQLDPDLLAGNVTRTITSEDFRVPTTVDDFGSRLYAVNARFGTDPTPDTEYEIVRVDKY